ncbi:Imm9 family immunity protein [Runella sp. MFBS21]|uniref:Imm9 family immunity protein n=1 Tax=Runella sp. MFBS21 TaxID=3034018 RepID=UPI0023F7E3B2|nr:Imm9 family immunity protein [Runella sp. MFBS21]MDF7821458.1 Imm9 family immunity protein [Runella sp. MFBS21]
MESRITHTSYISHFLDVGFDSIKISKLLKQEIDNALEKNNFSIQNDWVIQFRATYSTGKKLLVSKNKFGSYSADKIKEITIPIPIPTAHIVPWGIDKEQFTYDDEHCDKIIANFWTLDVDFYKYSNREEYILDCLRRAIKKI